MYKHLPLMLILLPAGLAWAQAQPCPTPVAYGENAAAGHTAKVNGIAMYYETYGSGPPLLLIHGNGGSIASMRCQIPFFAASYTVIAADSRSHGKTEDGTGRLTYEQMADDLAGLLDTMHVKSVDVIGHSDGGILALLLAMRHPEKVKALVASSPNLRPDPTALYPWVLADIKKARDEAETKMAQGDHSRDWARVKRWNELMLNEPHIPLTDLRRIRVPVLITGADEDMIPPEHLLEIYRNIPKAQLFIAPGTTHFMLREQYALYNEIAERFLKQPFHRPTSKK